MTEMNGTARRAEILNLLQTTASPLSGSTLASKFSVSRQVIVQDIALIRAKGFKIIATNRGYVLAKKERLQRIFKDYHTNEQTEEELNLIIDLGGWVEDVFVYHKVYGIIRGDLNLHSRKDISEYIKTIKSGKSTLLMSTTSGFHYHTVSADNKETLDEIQKALDEHHFLAKLQDYEPVDFRKNQN